MMEKERREEVDAMLEKAWRILSDARLLVGEERYESAASRAYYAIFHAMQAALLYKGLTFSRHSGVISNFSKEFLRSGVFPAGFSRIIDRLRRDRDTGDYSYRQMPSPEAAEENLRDAERMIRAIDEFLQQES